MSALLPAALDPALPQLGDCLDATGTARALERSWPAPVPGGNPVHVLECSRHHVRYEPGVRCAVAWSVRVQLDGLAPATTIAVTEVDAGGRRQRLFGDDPALPGLATASDAAAMAPRLREATGVDRWTARVVRYRAGERAVVRYEGQTDGEDPVERRLLYAKVLARGAAALDATLRAWHEAARHRPFLPAVGAPVALYEELGAVVGEATPGQPIRDVLYGPEAGDRARGDVLRRAGRALAALAGADLGPVPTTAMADLLEPVRSIVPLVRADSPALAARLEEAVEALDGDGDEPTVASHGSYRADHVLLDGARTYVLDVDGVCRAAPERDAGNLLAYLRWKAVREPARADVADQAAPALEAGYAFGRPALDRNRLRRYEATALLRIAAGRYRNLAVEQWPLVPALLDAATSLVQDRVRAVP